jgi:uncharacterized protein YbaP (TraB family)
MPNAVRTCLFVILIALAAPDYAETGAGCPPAPEQPTPEILRAAMRNAHDHGFLWRISKDGRTSFLYGTIHVAKLDWAVPGPAVMRALDATDTVALELDVLDQDVQAQMAKGMTAMRQTALPASLAKRLRKQAESVCVPYESLGKLSPEMQIITLTMMVGRWDGLDASFGTDIVLAGMGHRAKKNVVSLETAESQLKVLQMVSPKKSISFVQSALEELESGRSRALIDRFSTTWANADYAEMTRYEEWCDCLKTDIEREMMKRVLDARNPNLADRIDALHGSGKQVFAAVGSLHMFGPTGLPTLMAKRGYNVERVDLEPR